MTIDRKMVRNIHCIDSIFQWRWSVVPNVNEEIVLLWVTQDKQFFKVDKIWLRKGRNTKTKWLKSDLRQRILQGTKDLIAQWKNLENQEEQWLKSQSRQRMFQDRSKLTAQWINLEKPRWTVTKELLKTKNVLR